MNGVLFGWEVRATWYPALRAPRTLHVAGYMVVDMIKKSDINSHMKGELYDILCKATWTSKH